MKYYLLFFFFFSYTQIVNIPKTTRVFAPARVLLQIKDNEGDSSLLRARLQKSREEIAFFSENEKGSDDISSHRKPALQRLLLFLKSCFFRVYFDSRGCLQEFL